jgi:hypothetical protein
VDEKNSWMSLLADPNKPAATTATNQPSDLLLPVNVTLPDSSQHLDFYSSMPVNLDMFKTSDMDQEAIAAMFLSSIRNQDQAAFKSAKATVKITITDLEHDAEEDDVIPTRKLRSASSAGADGTFNFLDALKPKRKKMERVESEERNPCIFPNCGMTFYRKSIRNEHYAEVHPGFRPFPCTQCEWRFMVYCYL